MQPALECLACEQIRDRIVMDLVVLSPLHIGSREGVLTSLDFVHDRGMTHVISEERFGAFLKEKTAIDAFVDDIRGGLWDVGKFIKDRCGNPNLASLLPRISRYSIPGGGPRIRFRPFTRDGNGQVHLPGTSLKGVLRTAFLMSILQNNPAQASKIEQEVRTQISTMAHSQKPFFSSKWLNEGLLQHFNLSTSPQARQGPNRDILRTLTVRDAYPVGQVKTEIIKILFLSRNSEGNFTWSKKKSGSGPLEIWLEAVTQGRFRAEILFDREIFALFKDTDQLFTPEKGLSSFLGAGFSMSSKLIEHENGFLTSTPGGDPSARAAAGSLAKWYAGCPGQLLRVGFGSGMLGTSIGLQLDEATRRQVRNKCGHDRGDAPAPKTRRIWQKSDESWLPMGWLRPVAPRDEASTPPGIPGVGSAHKDPDSGVSSHVSRRVKSPPPRIMESRKINPKVLLADAAVVRLDDKISFKRMVEALDAVEDQSLAGEIAQVLKDRLLKAGTWKKHPLRREIEGYLEV